MKETPGLRKIFLNATVAGFKAKEKPLSLRKTAWIFAYPAGSRKNTTV